MRRIPNHANRLNYINRPVVLFHNIALSDATDFVQTCDNFSITYNFNIISQVLIKLVTVCIDYCIKSGTIGDTSESVIVH